MYIYIYIHIVRTRGLTQNWQPAGETQPKSIAMSANREEPGTKNTRSAYSFG